MGGLLVRQYVASFRGGSRIDCYISLIDVLNDAILVDDKCGSIAEALFFVEDSVIFHNSSFEITEKWKRDADVLCKTAVGRNTVDADAENLSIGPFEFGDISLIRLQLLRSTTREGQHIEGEHYIFLSFEIAQFHLLTSSAWECEIRCSVTNLQLCLRRARLLRVDDNT